MSFAIFSIVLFPLFWLICRGSLCFNALSLFVVIATSSRYCFIVLCYGIFIVFSVYVAVESYGNQGRMNK